MSNGALGAPSPVPGFNNTSYTEASLPTAAVAALTLPMGYRVQCTDSGVERTLLSAGGVPYWLPIVPSGAGISVDTVLYVDSVNGSDATGNGSQGRPFATFARAYALIPPNPTGKTRIMLLGAGPYALPANLYGVDPTGPLGQPLVIVGDAWTQVGAGTLTGVAGATATTDQNYAADQMRGAVYHGLTGTSAGKFHMVATNTAGAGSVLSSVGNAFNAGIGDTFELLRPTTALTMPSVMVLDSGFAAFWRCKFNGPGTIEVSDVAVALFDMCEFSALAHFDVRWGGHAYFMGMNFPEWSFLITDVGTQSGLGAAYYHNTGGVAFRLANGGRLTGYLVTGEQMTVDDRSSLELNGYDLVCAAASAIGIQADRGSSVNLNGGWQRIAMGGAGNPTGVQLLDGSVGYLLNLAITGCNGSQPCIDVNTRSYAFMQSCTGATNNALAGLLVRNAGAAFASSGNTITGTGGDVQIDSRTGVAWATVGQPGMAVSGAGGAGAMVSFALLHAGGAGAVATFAGMGGLPVAANSSATALRYPVTPGRLAKNLRATVLTNASAAAVALTVMKAPVATGVPAATAVTVTVGAGATGSFSDTTHTVQFLDGDQIDLQASSTAGGAGNNLTATVAVQMS